MSKENGGLGLRDLSAFNDALLAKQFWRLETNPKSFAATVLRGKYHPRQTVWEATTPQNSSFTWRSIMSAKNLVREGARWVVGDGRSTHFWKDAWLSNLPGGCIISTPPNEGMQNAMVAERWDGELGRWELEDLLDVITDEEMKAIKATRLASSMQDNFLAWPHTSRGDFTVRSAYHLELQRRKGGEGASNVAANGWIWKKVWKAGVPQKVKHMVWRALRNDLPTMDTLARRGVELILDAPGVEKVGKQSVICTTMQGDQGTLAPLTPTPGHR